MNIEEHKDSPGYFVSADGRVFKELTGSRYGDGVRLVSVKGKLQSLGRFIARHYLPDPDFPAPVAMYRDGDKSNCHPANLVWVRKPSVGDGGKDGGGGGFEKYWKEVREAIASDPTIQIYNPKAIE